MKTQLVLPKKGFNILSESNVVISIYPITPNYSHGHSIFADSLAILPLGEWLLKTKLFLGNRSLIKNKAKTAVINIVNFPIFV